MRPLKKRMPQFIHELPGAKVLFEILGAEKKLLPIVIEKDYWIMHCLWGLQRNGFLFEMKGGTSLFKGWGCIDRFSEDIDIRFEPPAGLNVKGDNPAPAILGERISASGAVRQTVPKSQQKHGIHVESTLSVLFSDWAVALRG